MRMMGSVQVLLGLHLRLRCEVRCHPLRLLQEATCARRWCRASSWMGVRPLPLAWTPRRAAAARVAVRVCDGGANQWFPPPKPSWLCALVVRLGCACWWRDSLAHQPCWGSRQHCGMMLPVKMPEPWLQPSLEQCSKDAAPVGCRSWLRRLPAQVACASCSRNRVAQQSCELQSRTAVVHWYCRNVRQRLWDDQSPEVLRRC